MHQNISNSRSFHFAIAPASINFLSFAVTYTPELIPWHVNNTLHPDFSSSPSETLYSTHPPITTSYKNQPIPPLHPKNLKPLPALDLKNKSGGGKGPLGRPDICSKDPEHVIHLQMMPATPGCYLGIYGPDKDGVDWAFGSFTEAEVNDLQEKNRDRKEPISHLGV